jgi:hypothetical protein
MNESENEDVDVDSFDPQHSDEAVDPNADAPTQLYSGLGGSGVSVFELDADADADEDALSLDYASALALVNRTDPLAQAMHSTAELEALPHPLPHLRPHLRPHPDPEPRARRQGQVRPSVDAELETVELAIDSQDLVANQLDYEAALAIVAKGAATDKQ